MKVRIAVDLAKSIYQVAESVRVGQVSQRKRLNCEAFKRHIQEHAEPVEWVMEASGTPHCRGASHSLSGIEFSCYLPAMHGPIGAGARPTATPLAAGALMRNGSWPTVAGQGWRPLRGVKRQLATGNNRPILLKKATSERVAFRQLKNHSILALLRKNQYSSAF